MAYFGGGQFARAETSYQDPWEYREAMGRMAGEKAGYLSEMDKFYESLAFEEEKEATRAEEWLKKLAFEEETQEEELAWGKEKFRKELGFQEEEAEAGREHEMSMFMRNLLYGDRGGAGAGGAGGMTGMIRGASGGLIPTSEIKYGKYGQRFVQERDPRQISSEFGNQLRMEAIRRQHALTGKVKGYQSLMSGIY